MCLENLPIAFDETGRARLEEDGSFAVAPSNDAPARSREANGAAAQGNGAGPSDDGRTREFNIDPVTRVAGALSFHTRLDDERGVVTEAHSHAVQFRGYELILKGRNPSTRSTSPRERAASAEASTRRVPPWPSR